MSNETPTTSADQIRKNYLDTVSRTYKRIRKQLQGTRFLASEKTYTRIANLIRTVLSQPPYDLPFEKTSTSEAIRLHDLANIYIAAAPPSWILDNQKNLLRAAILEIRPPQ